MIMCDVLVAIFQIAPADYTHDHEQPNGYQKPLFGAWGGG